MLCDSILLSWILYGSLVARFRKPHHRDAAESELNVIFRQAPCCAMQLLGSFFRGFTDASGPPPKRSSMGSDMKVKSGSALHIVPNARTAGPRARRGRRGQRRHLVSRHVHWFAFCSCAMACSHEMAASGHQPSTHVATALFVVAAPLETMDQGLFF